MNSYPCERKDAIDILVVEVAEMRSDVKKLLEFKNKAMGMITGATIACNILAFIIGKFF